ncbi:hypothetical protein MMC30_000482 [Trapelia coarctata]|nr:hypothetical protein [Trapelia coarctata]
MSASRKSILITGCSPGGIGHALAREFHARGLRVFPTARKAETVSDLAELGMECLSLTVDDPESVEACYKEVARLVGSNGLDYLFNNAGRNYTMPALDISLPEVQLTFATNLFSIMHINATFTPLLLLSHGTYIHTGSVAAILPYVFGAVYNASKAALHAYCNTLRVEMAPFDVKVLTIVTGGVKSNIARTERVLPEGSLYKGIEGIYERRQKHSQEVGMDTEVYAREVVREVLGEGWSLGRWWRNGEVWAGAKWRFVWWGEVLDRWVPGGVYGPAIGWMFGLGALKGGVAKKKV